MLDAGCSVFEVLDTTPFFIIVMVSLDFGGSSPAQQNANFPYTHGYK